MTEFSQRRAPEAGFSLVELLLVLGMMAMLAGMAVIQIAASRPGAVGDGAMRALLAQMNAGRELAITQRRNMRPTFTTGNLVDVIRAEGLLLPLTTSSPALTASRLKSRRAFALPAAPSPI